MTQNQKIIKSLAIALGVFIIVIICSSILSAFGVASNIIEFTLEDRPISSKIEDFTKYEDVTKLRIDLEVTSLEIYRSDEFKIEKVDLKDNNIYISKNKNRLEIKEKDTGFLHHKTINGKIILYLPTEMELDTLEINMGAGKLTIDGIDAEKLNLTQGAGKLTIDNSNYNKTLIDGGAGKIEIRNSELHNLELNTGVGSTTIDGIISGISEIECGIGSVDIKLSGSKEDYYLDIEKGIGSINVDNKSVSNGIIGSGVNSIKIEGGIGSINIEFKDITN